MEALEMARKEDERKDMNKGMAEINHENWNSNRR